jgi:hypothetical protein
VRTHADSEENLSAGIVPAITPKAPWRVATVCSLPGFRLSVRFNDGSEGTVTMSRFIHSPNAGVFEILQDEELFSKVGVEYGAVTWPGGLDLAPDAMYDAICLTGEYVLEITPASI